MVSLYPRTNSVFPTLVCSYLLKILLRIETTLRTACLLEVTARKPGNVHPLAAFADCNWEAFAASADAIAPVLAGAGSRPLGESILRAVEATKERVGRNTNLGMILLIAPLAAVPVDQDLREGVRQVLAKTTVDDCRLVYEAIRLARPGGLGKAAEEDVAAAPSVSLTQAMKLASHRDDVARQYDCDFADVFELAGSLRGTTLPEVETQIVAAFVGRLATRLDTLILRKCGVEIAQRASELAAACVTPGLPESSVDGLSQLDQFLRADGNRRNPGTTADLLAAALLVAIRKRQIPCFNADEVHAFAERLRGAGNVTWDGRGPR